MEKGYILDNRYEILEILGSGGMGKVYLAKNIILGTLWTIKEIRKNSNDLDGVLSEVELLKNLEHPALPKVFDVLEDYGSFFVVFTYIKGVALSEKLIEVGSFDEKTVAEFAICLCDVLSYLHTRRPKPIIYRDLKPSNIILCDDGNIKLIDFGIAREFKEENTQDTIYIGTKGYAAPEQYGEGQSGPYTDIYSLGVTLKQLLTGKSPLSLPYGIPPVTQLNPNVSKRLEQILEKCTRKEITKRYESADELKDEFISLSKKGSSKQKQVETIIKTEKKAFFKQIIISLNNDEFTSELAIAACSKGMTVLLIDMANCVPLCDFYLGIQTGYKEHRVMMGIETNLLDDIEMCTSDLNKYLYKSPMINGLSYLALNVAGLNEDNTSAFFNNVRNKFDFIIVSASVNNLGPAKSLFNCADRIAIADKVYLDRVNYWRRLFTTVFKEFGIQMDKVSYFGWLYQRDERSLIKMTKEILYDADFFEGISLKSGRRNNINNTMGPAILNYRESEKEYLKILFSLRMSPVAYMENLGKGVFSFLRERRGMI